MILSQKNANIVLSLLNCTIFADLMDFVCTLGNLRQPRTNIGNFQPEQIEKG